MPARKSLTTFTAGKKLNLGGTTYQPGDTIPPAVVGAVPRVSALLSRRLIIPNQDPYRRRTKAATPRPVSLSRPEIRAIKALS